MKTTREEEMSKLRDRYARLQKGEKEPVEKPKEKEVPVIKTKNIKFKVNFKPYLFLIENDIRKIFRLPQKEWKLGGLKFEGLKKPLNLDWLKKNGGKLF
ncbi:MAG: hypothetical protein WC648_04805, partial [Candidatus Paceibacterota bacterium]